MAKPQKSARRRDTPKPGSRNRPALTDRERAVRKRESSVRQQKQLLERREISLRALLDTGMHDLRDANQSLTLYSLGAHLRVEAAEAANREQEEFLATMSHELRTPLTAVLGWTRLLLSTPMSTEERQKALAIVEHNAEALAHLVEGLLDTSRVALGALRLARGLVPLAPIVAAAVDAIRPLAADRKIKMGVRLAGPEAGFVFGDTGRLRQIVANLLTNAIKFTPAGGRVDVDLHLPSAAPGWIELHVRDTGIGIAAEVLPHVFKRFRQAPTPTTVRAGAAHRETSESGLGLGLAIVRELVEAHGGTVEASSGGPGQGAVFIVRLPLASPAEADTARVPDHYFRLTGVRPGAAKPLNPFPLERAADPRAVFRPGTAPPR